MEQLGGFCCFETHKVVPFRVNEVIFLPASPWKKARKSWNPKPTKKGELKHGWHPQEFCWQDSWMFRSCIEIVVRFAIFLFCPDKSVIFGWFLCVYKHWYLFVRKSLHLFRPPPFSRGQREHGTSSCEQRGAPPSNQATGPNRETTTPLAVLTWWMTTSFEFFFGFLKGKLPSKPWTCLFSKLSLDLSRFGGWTITRVTRVFFPNMNHPNILRGNNVANHASFRQFCCDVSKWRTSKKKLGTKWKTKITSNQSFQSCCPHFAFFFCGGGGRGNGGGGFKGSFLIGSWRSSFHQLKAAGCSDHALTSKWPKIPWPSPSP